MGGRILRLTLLSALFLPYLAQYRAQNVAITDELEPALATPLATPWLNETRALRFEDGKKERRKKEKRRQQQARVEGTVHRNVHDLWLLNGTTVGTRLKMTETPEAKVKNDSQKRVIANHTYAWLRTLFSVMPHHYKAPNTQLVYSSDEPSQRQASKSNNIHTKRPPQSDDSMVITSSSPPYPTPKIQPAEAHVLGHITQSAGPIGGVKRATSTPLGPLLPDFDDLRFLIPNGIDHRSPLIPIDDFPGEDLDDFRGPVSGYYETWMIIIAAVCFFTTLLTLCTYWLDPSRFKYPQKPIIHYAACYWILSTVYLFHHLPAKRQTSGPGSKLEPDGAAECRLSTDDRLWSGHSAAIFVLYLYFEVAASLWWVTLALCWYLSAGRKWSHEAVRQLTTWYHLVCWTAPALLTITVLVSNTRPRGWGSEVKATLQPQNLVINPVRAYFILIGPLVLTLTTGSLLVMAGLLSLKAIKKAMRSCHTSTTNLERLTFRISLFALLYVSFKLALLACFALKVPHRPEPSQGLQVDPTQSQPILTPDHALKFGHDYQHLLGPPVNLATDGSKSSLDKDLFHPAHALPNDNGGSLRIERMTMFPPSLGLILFFSLSSGIFSGIWIFNAKTLTAWHAFFFLARSMAKDFLSIASNKGKHHNCFLAHDNYSTNSCDKTNSLRQGNGGYLCYRHLEEQTHSLIKSQQIQRPCNCKGHHHLEKSNSAIAGTLDNEIPLIMTSARPWSCQHSVLTRQSLPDEIMPRIHKSCRR